MNNLQHIRSKVKPEKKARFRDTLLYYLTNEKNHWPSRHEMAALVGISYQRFYHYFSPAEITAIEAEARIIRRKAHKSELDEIDKAMIRKAKAGHVGAATLVYDKLDEPTPKQVEVTGKDGEPFRIQAEVLLAALVKANEPQS